MDSTPSSNRIPDPSPGKPSRRALALVAAALVIVGAVGGIVWWRQSSSVSTLATAAANNVAATLPVSLSAQTATSSGTPRWADLSAEQKIILAPLEGEWQALETTRRLKWLEVTRHYFELSPEKQRRLQQRMGEWARLTPEQRRVARDTYARMQPLTPERRAEVLQKYQQLPSETREQLTAQAKEHRSILHARIQTVQHTVVPIKVQIREGAKQRVPGPPVVAHSGASMAPGTAPIPTAAPAPPAAGAAPLGTAPASVAPDVAQPVSQVTPPP
jgi:hypothetical protein